jgi:hypothetical protein
VRAVRPLALSGITRVIEELLDERFERGVDAVIE